MFLLIVLYITYFKVTLCLPPTPTNVYNTGNVGISYENRFNEKFLQNTRDFPQPNILKGNAFVNAYNGGVQNKAKSDKNPSIDSQSVVPAHNVQNNGERTPVKNNVAIITQDYSVRNDEKFRNPINPQIKDKIGIVGQNFDNGFKRLQQERALNQFRELNMAKQYPQQFKINLRGFVAPEVNNMLIPPKPILAKPFLTMQPHVLPVRKLIQPPFQGIPTLQNLPFNVKRPVLSQPTSTIPIHTLVPPINQVPKKTYTIIYPNGTTEQADSLEALKKEYPNYILRNPKDATHIPKKETNKVPETVYAKSPVANPILVPIYNVPVPKLLPKDHPKETLVPHTLLGTTQVNIAPTIVMRKPIHNTNINKGTMKPLPVLSGDLSIGYLNISNDIPKTNKSDDFQANISILDTNKNFATPTPIPNETAVTTVEPISGIKKETMKPLPVLSGELTPGFENSTNDIPKTNESDNFQTNISILDTNKNFATPTPILNETSVTTEEPITGIDEDQDKHAFLEDLSAEEFWKPVNMTKIFESINQALSSQENSNSSLHDNASYHEVPNGNKSFVKNDTAIQEKQNSRSEFLLNEAIQNSNDTIMNKTISNPDKEGDSQIENDKQKSNQTNILLVVVSEDLTLNLNATDQLDNLTQDVNNNEQMAHVGEEIRNELIKSIDDMMELMVPILQVGDTDNVTSLNDNFPEKFDESDSDLKLEYQSDVNNQTENSAEFIYIPNISALKANDTDSRFWFKTNDDKVWERLGQQNVTNFFFIPPKVMVEKDKSVTIYPNGTKLEVITKITKSYNGGKTLISETTRIIQPNGDVEIVRDT